MPADDGRYGATLSQPNDLQMICVCAADVNTCCMLDDDALRSKVVLGAGAWGGAARLSALKAVNTFSERS
jgi:hypothetical protein